MLNRFRKSSPRYFLTKAETAELGRRVEAFESVTGCELVFHFRRALKGDPVEANRRLFHKFKLDQTSDRRAILFTLAVGERKYAVWADKGVEEHVGQALHDKIASSLVPALKNGRHLTGLIAVIQEAETLLKTMSPATGRHGQNEISNEPIIEDDEK